jgi:hypothetical protein
MDRTGEGHKHGRYDGGVPRPCDLLITFVIDEQENSSESELLSQIAFPDQAWIHHQDGEGPIQRHHAM